MENLYGGLAVFVGITMVISFIFGEVAANGFVEFVIGFFEGIVNALLTVFTSFL